MKKLLLIIITFSFAFSFANAQGFDYFKANEGLERAREQAEGTGYENAKLVFIGTIKQTFDLGVAGELTIELKIEDGTSNGWVYLFRANDNLEDMVAYLVVKSGLLGFLPFPVPVTDLLEGGIPIEPEYTLDDVEWIGSDVACQRLRETSEFMDYYNAHPEPDQFMFGLFKNSLYEFIDVGAAMWGVSIRDEITGKTCGVDAVTEEVYCSNISSIEENTSNQNIFISPNPAFDNINIEFSEYPEYNKLYIFNQLGQIVKTVEIQSNNVSISIDTMPAGIYYVKQPNGIMKQFVIIK